ncbi:MAG: anthranilate phosphoribosyltransferase [Pseudomonadota bacterium]
MAKYTGDIPPVAHAELIHSVIQRVATGPELSKNISYDEARSVSNALLEGSMDPVQAAVFLIGLRMKRETDPELQGLLDALNDKTTHITAQPDDVIVLSDPYNGFNRTLHASLFVLPVLAACGVSAYSHGVELCGPKFGVTHHQIIKALGGNPLESMDKVADRLADNSVGWGYADQSIFCKPLSDLIPLRTKIIKRPALSTTEVMLTPVTGQQRTHLVTGYVHKPYREIYAMLARHLNLDSLLLIRGTEGGVIPSFKAKAHFVRYQGNSDAEEHDVDLEPIDLNRNYRAEDIPETMPTAGKSDHIGTKWDNKALAKMCADKGIAALQGEPGAIYDAAVLGSGLIMWHIGKAASLKEATDAARQAISSGEALQRLHAGLGTDH